MELVQRAALFVRRVFYARPGAAFLAVLVMVVFLSYVYAQAHSHARKKAAPAPQPPAATSINGAPLAVSGDYVVPRITTTKGLPTADGQVCSGLLIEPVVVRDTIVGPPGPDRTRSTVSFPLPGDVKSVSFTVRQAALAGDITRYAYGTTVDITDEKGRPVKKIEITKESMLTVPVEVRLNGVRQVNLILGTTGKKTEKGEADQAGPWLPVVLTDVNFEN
ncbi:MAG: hypothetical protein ACUVSK_14300 [Desulfotomaculales bacterium]